MIPHGRGLARLFSIKTLRCFSDPGQPRTATPRLHARDGDLTRDGFIYVSENYLYVVGAYLDKWTGDAYYSLVYPQSESFHQTVDIIPLQKLEKVSGKVGWRGAKLELKFRDMEYDYHDLEKRSFPVFIVPFFVIYYKWDKPAKRKRGKLRYTLELAKLPNEDKDSLKQRVWALTNALERK